MNPRTHSLLRGGCIDPYGAMIDPFAAEPMDGIDPVPQGLEG